MRDNLDGLRALWSNEFGAILPVSQRRLIEAKAVKQPSIKLKLDHKEGKYKMVSNMRIVIVVPGSVSGVAVPYTEELMNALSDSVCVAVSESISRESGDSFTIFENRHSPRLLVLNQRGISQPKPSTAHMKAVLETEIASYEEALKEAKKRLEEY